MLYQDAFLQRLEKGLRGTLPKWGLPQTASVSLLTISENATYIVDDDRHGRRLVLRVHRPHYHTENEILSELAWIMALRESGVVETPRPVPAEDGTLLCSFPDGDTRRFVVAFEHMSGKEPDSSDDLVKWYGRLGEINARLHMHSRNWTRPAGFARRTWNFDTIIGKRASWGDWREALGLTEEGRSLLERTAKRLEELTRAYGEGPDRFGLIHFDLRLANLLVEGNRLGVIDFDDCGMSWFPYDFASAVSFIEHEPYIGALMAAWVEGYRKVSRLSKEDEASLPMFVMLRRMQLTAWVASHAETPTAQAMGEPYTQGTVALAEKFLTREGLMLKTTAKTKQILALNRFEARHAEGLDAELESLIARRQATFGASSVLVYQRPIRMVRAEGVWMFDADGRRYLDVYNNVASVGHCHPRVVEAIAKQAATLNTNTRYLYDNVHDYAERLLKTFPARLSNIVFTCTGSESNDFALRLTKSFTGGTGIVVTEHAYHGNTEAVTEVSPSSFKTGSVSPYVRTVPAPDLYRRPTNDVGARFAEDVAKAIADLERNGVKFGGLLVDSIFSSDGIYANPAGFLKQAVDVVHEAGGLFISDEVQPGFGRTGTGMWGFERHSVEPDIVTLGKPMGNGFPVAGVVTRPEILESLCETTGYFNTFGGNPVAAAAGLAVLDVIEDEGLIDNANRVGGYFRSRLQDLAGRHQGIGDVRGAGLFIGVEFSLPGTTEPDAATASSVINDLKERGVLIGAAGSYGNVLKVRPPLCFTRDNADFFVETLDAVLSER